jgi:glycine dehydrogenase subunit 2
MKLIFERSIPGTSCGLLPPCDVETFELSPEQKRKAALKLPELTEGEISRHYTALENEVFGVNSGYYPLGSCTMKYNPKINDEVASLAGFTEIHPLQPAHTVEGCVEALRLAEQVFCEITGMDAMTFQPAAGAHGELTGILLIKKYHETRGDSARTKILVPDTAHGTNPASVTMVGLKSVAVPSGPDGLVDLDALRKAAGPDTAGLMLTNPNTLGLFEKDILQIAKIVHDAGGLLYYDGANLNPVMGIARPGDMGFDVVHLNLHKTFSTPHGGGGPGSGPVGCKQTLAEFLPGNGNANSIGSVKAFYGNFTVTLKALAYVFTLGREGIPEAAKSAVLNANYMMKKLDDLYTVAYPGRCMHEFVLTAEPLKKRTGVSALDIAKGLLDNGMHPPTIYFPINVHEALMIEPTDTESKESIDEAVKIYRELYELAQTDPDALHQAPVNTTVRRLDEVTAAREPVLKARL